eukprot:scaffold39415_cov52-Attheya_sp.AAC.1
MMSSLIDFINEETLLQYHGKMLGVLVDRSPKCHPEVAGEGIEYSWGCGKGKYRRLPLTDKRRKENFRNSVRQCLDRTTVLTIERQRMFSKRARQYMLAYHSIELSKEKRESAGEAESSNEKLEMSAYLVEKIIKTYKSHRGATDFDSAYIGAIVNDMKSGVGCSVTHNIDTADEEAAIVKKKVFRSSSFLLRSKLPQPGWKYWSTVGPTDCRS